MLLFLKSPAMLSLAKEALIRLGVEHSLVRDQETEIALEIQSELSIYPQKKIAEELAHFGKIMMSPSKTPLLDALPESHTVSVKLPKDKEAIFSRDGKRPVWIAGPCSLDDLGRLRETASFLSGLGVSILRGGAVKPRTSPHDYQGVGRQGYQWLADVAHENGMAAISEALSEDDVPEALEYLDLIQVGARNMQNFPLLKKLGKGNRPILLKRSPGSTLREWALAAEHVLSAGNKQIILCERGVRGLERELRYTLDLAGAAWMQKRFHLPVVIDPSHATGTKQILPDCVAASIAMKMSGVMVEVYPKPSDAKSDALQALNYDEFAQLAKGFLPI